MPKTPGLRLHPRTMKVSQASADLRLFLLDFQEKQGLTDAEMLHMLNAHQERIVTWMLRKERHPDDPGRKADEA